MRKLCFYSFSLSFISYLNCIVVFGNWLQKEEQEEQEEQVES